MQMEVKPPWKPVAVRLGLILMEAVGRRVGGGATKERGTKVNEDDVKQGLEKSVSEQNPLCFST